MIEEDAPRIAVTRPFVTETFFRPPTVVDGVVRLHRSDDVELRKSLKILRRHVLRVLDGKTLVVITVLSFDITENIENHRDRAVADCMNAKLQSCRIGLHQPVAHGAGRMHFITQ